MPGLSGTISVSVISVPHRAHGGRVIVIGVDRIELDNDMAGLPHRREHNALSHRRLTDRVGDRGSVHQREQYVWSVLLTFKVSHWLIQNRPLGVETGQS